MEENQNPNNKENQNVNNTNQEQFQYQPQGGQPQGGQPQGGQPQGGQPQGGQPQGGQPQGGQPQGGQPQMGQPQGQRPGQPNMNQPPKKKSNVGIIIAIIIGVLIVLSIPLILILIFAGKIIGDTVKGIDEVDNVLSGYYYDYDDDEYNTSYYNTNYYNTSSKNTTSKNTTTNTTNKNTTSNTTSKNTTTNNTTNSSSVNTKESSISSPLKINEWGLASKYVSKYLSEEYSDTSYIDVPVRVTNVTRGEEAEKIIKEWCNNQTFYSYQEPKANTEWVVFDYEVDLSKVTFDQGTIGTDTKISSSVKGLDGNSVKYNDVTYILSTTDISGSEYKKQPGVYKGKFIVMLPIGCKDYLVKLGDSYNGAESFFRVEQ